MCADNITIVYTIMYKMAGEHFNYRMTTDSDECLKSQVVYSKQPKLGLTQEFVVDCAHALWVVHSIKRLVSLMLLKWFLSDSFIYFMYRMFNEIF